MIDPKTDPPLVAAQIINPIRDRLALLRNHEVVHPHLLRLSLRAPLPARVLEVANQLFLLRVYRENRLASLLLQTHLLVQVLQLRVPVWMR